MNDFIGNSSDSSSESDSDSDSIVRFARFDSGREANFSGFGEPDDTPVFTDDGWQHPPPGREPRILN